jgi:hypothetical protein
MATGRVMSKRLAIFTVAVVIVGAAALLGVAHLLAEGFEALP